MSPVKSCTDTLRALRLSMGLWVWPDGSIPIVSSERGESAGLSAVDSHGRTKQVRYSSRLTIPRGSIASYPRKGQEPFAKTPPMRLLVPQRPRTLPCRPAILSPFLFTQTALAPVADCCHPARFFSAQNSDGSAKLSCRAILGDEPDVLGPTSTPG